MEKRVICLMFLIGLFSTQAIAQDESTTDSLTAVMEENIKPTIELNPSAAAKKKRKNKDGISKKKEVKRKKNEFWGVFSKKIILKTVRNSKYTIVEKFYILPGYQAPTKYVWDKYYFDPKNTKKRKIVKTNYISSKYGIPLHGSYEKFINGKLVMKGYYYKGTKHGRWVEYGRDMVLKKKEKWDKGYPKGSRVTYYDAKRTKVKEVTPYTYDQKEGLYMSFYASGRLKEMGYYENGERIGRWTEYYDRASKANRKRITRHRNHYWEDTEAIVENEW